MNNEMIGIIGVFALTLFLFVLRHLYLSFGRANRSGRTAPATFRRDHELNIGSDDDDGWLLWSPERDAQSGPPRIGVVNRHKAL
jgi:hypothetical protein